MKSLRSSIYLFFFLLSFSLSGQREGDKWVIGYFSYLGSHDYSVMHLDLRMYLQFFIIPCHLIQRLVLILTNIWKPE